MEFDNILLLHKLQHIKMLIMEWLSLSNYLPTIHEILLEFFSIVSYYHFNNLATVPITTIIAKTINRPAPKIPHPWVLVISESCNNTGAKITTKIITITTPITPSIISFKPTLIHQNTVLSLFLNSLWVSLDSKCFYIIFDTPTKDTITFYIIVIIINKNDGFIRRKSILILAYKMSEKSRIKEMINIRKTRGMILLENGITPEQKDHRTWIIPRTSMDKTYTVTVSNRNWRCTCPDYKYHSLNCKHICAVRIWTKLQHGFEQSNIDVEQVIKINDNEEMICCKHCHSTDFVKYGKRNNKQVYKCKSCKRKFVHSSSFENMKYDPHLIALTLDLYFRGMSLRKISSHLKQFHNLDVTHMTIYNWIEKYITIMNEYVNSIKPCVGDVWHTDEMMVNISGEWEYLWNVIDENTRFQLASVVSKERRVQDARMVFQKAKGNAGNRKPKYLVTDGLHSYRRAVNKEFPTNNYSTEHLWNVGLQHHPNNNHVERLHGTIREREKTMRGLKIESTPIVEGHRLYYNFIKPHDALDGMTPSEKAGITIEGDNKWLTLLKKAVEYEKSKSVVN